MAADFRPVLVVPVYNHGPAFATMLPDLLQHQLPIIAVDDGSNLETRKVLSRLAAETDQLTMLTHTSNQGKGGAVISGLRHAHQEGFTNALQIDADGQHDPADIGSFLQLGEQKPDHVIIGRPVFDESSPLGRRLARYLTHVWIWIETLSFDIADSMCGFRLYPLAATIPLLEGNRVGRRMDFDPEILVRLHWQGTPFLTVATRVIYPEAGTSGFRMLEDNALISWMHTRLFFGMLIRSPRLLARRVGPESAGHWATTAERGSYLGLRFMLFLYRSFGRALFEPVAFLVAGYFTLAAGTARRASREYLNQLWETSASECALLSKPTLGTTFSHFYQFAGAILDKVAAWSGDIHLEEIDHENLSLFEQRLNAGAGGVWITSHLGNIEVCRAIGQQQAAMALTVLVHTQHAANFNKLLNEVAPNAAVELLEVSQFDIAMAMKLHKRVNEGRFVIIVGDRIPVGESERVVSADFLGRPARFPTGPFLLATLLDCPVGTLFCVRESRRFRMFIDDLPELKGVSRKERGPAIERSVQLYARRLESLCRRYPLQWFNFFPYWSHPEDS